MKKLFIVYCESEDYGEGDLFLDAEGNTLAFNSCNDADWRHEYFNGILDSVGVKVIQRDMYEDEQFTEYVNLKLKTYHES